MSIKNKIKDLLTIRQTKTENLENDNYQYVVAQGLTSMVKCESCGEVYFKYNPIQDKVFSMLDIGCFNCNNKQYYTFVSLMLDVYEKSQIKKKQHVKKIVLIAGSIVEYSIEDIETISCDQLRSHIIKGIPVWLKFLDLKYSISVNWQSNEN